MLILDYGIVVISDKIIESMITSNEENRRNMKGDNKFADYIFFDFLGEVWINYGRKIYTKAKHVATVKALNNSVNTYFYFISDSEAEIKCDEGFTDVDCKYKKLRDFPCWNAVHEEVPFIGVNRLSLSIAKLKKNEERRLKYRVRMKAPYREIEPALEIDSHSYYFRLGAETHNTNLVFHIPNGTKSDIVYLVFIIQYKGDILYKEKITPKNKKEFTLGEGYGNGVIRIAKENTSVYWNIKKRLKRGILCELAWYTKSNKEVKKERNLKAVILKKLLSIRENLGDLYSRALYLLFLLLPYFLLIALSYAFLSSRPFFVSLIVGIPALVILTNHYSECLYIFVDNLFRRRKVEIPVIMHSEVSNVMKNYSVPYLLERSRLLKLKCVERRSMKNKYSKIDSLRDIIRDTIEYFNPKDKGTKRTSARLRYEILRMTAYEGATESQIMWDLGFFTFNRRAEEKISAEVKPRFPLTKGSEYAATSDRSFKRLKKEALEMLRWKLEEREKGI